MARDSTRQVVVAFADSSLDRIIFLEDNGDGTYTRKAITADDMASELATAAGVLLAANNLSDVGTLLTAQQNLELEKGVDVQAYNALLSGIAAQSPVADGDLLLANGANSFEKVSLSSAIETLLKAASLDAGGVVAKTGAQTVAGIKNFTSQSNLSGGARISVPADYWSAGGDAIFQSVGGFGTQGSFAMDFFANGYRNTSTLWTSMQAGTFLGAGILRFNPNGGDIAFYASSSWPTGSAITPPLVMILKGATGNLGVGTSGPSEKLEVSGNVRLSGVLYLGTYTVSTLPTATVRGFIFVSDETGGATTAFSDGTNWRRSQDRAIVS